FQSGSSGSVTSNTFDGGVNPDNGTDLRIDSGAGTVTLGAANNFAGDSLFIDNQTAVDYDLTGGNAQTYDQANNFRIEDHMFHKVDDLTKGLVRWVANNIYVTDAGTD